MARRRHVKFRLAPLSNGTPVFDLRGFAVISDRLSFRRYFPPHYCDTRGFIHTPASRTHHTPGRRFGSRPNKTSNVAFPGFRSVSLMVMS